MPPSATPMKRWPTTTPRSAVRRRAETSRIGGKASASSTSVGRRRPSRHSTRRWGSDRRTRLRRTDVTDRLGRLSNEFGMTIPEDDSPIDEAEAGPHRLVLRGDEPIVLLLGDQAAPTVRALLAFPATRRWVTVDMGAVR